MRFRQHQDAAAHSTRRLLLLFALVVVGLVLAVNVSLALLWWLIAPYASALPRHFVATNTGLVLLYVLGGCAVETARLRGGGAHVARMAGAREAQPGRGSALSMFERRFVNVVQEMAIASGVHPPPAAWVLARDDAINALAAGWNDDDAVVAVTRGALECLTRAELAGVVAHEMSHLAHQDGRLNMVLVGMVWGLQLIWNLGQAMMSSDEKGRRGALFPIGVVLLAVGSLGWLAGRVLQAAVSRQREFLADASAVKYTRQVDGLGCALRKLADQQSKGRLGLHSGQMSTLQHLLFAPTVLLGRSRALLATHPPLSARIARLYGHDEEPIDARALPAPDVDEALHPALLALHSHSADAVIGQVWPLDAQAPRHDAMQRPAHFDAAEREREALGRIALWHGPGEWQVAMLALAIEPAATGRPEALAHWRALQTATADLGVATAVQTEVAALGAVQRRLVFEQLLHRAAAAAPAARRQLWIAWAERSATVLGTAHREPPHRWRAFVIRHRLAPQHAGAARGTLATLPNAVRAATHAMGLCLGLGASEQRAWSEASLTLLSAFGLPAFHGRAAGLAPAVETGLPVLSALRVRHLSPMQKPLLLRAWVQAAQSTGVLSQHSAADALYFAALALGVPEPAALLQPSSD